MLGSPHSTGLPVTMRYQRKAAGMPSHSATERSRRRRWCSRERPTSSSPARNTELLDSVPSKPSRSVPGTVPPTVGQATPASPSVTIAGSLSPTRQYGETQRKGRHPSGLETCEQVDFEPFRARGTEGSASQAKVLDAHRFWTNQLRHREEVVLFTD